MSYSITFRETGEPVVIYSQPDFKKQVETNRKARELLGSKASNVLLVQVMTKDFNVILIDTKALIVRFYHSKDPARMDMFTKADALMMAGDRVQSEEVFWTAITKPSLIDSGAVNEDGSLKPYSSFNNHRSRPLTAEEVDGEELQYFDAGAY